MPGRRGGGKRGKRGGKRKGSARKSTSETKHIKFEFMDKILSWRREAICNDKLIFSNPAQAPTMTSVFASKQAYFGAFSPLIFEEVRAQAQQKINRNLFYNNCTVSKAFAVKQEKNAFTFKLTAYTSTYLDSLRAHDWVLVKHDKLPNVEIFGVTMFVKQKYNEYKVEVKAICPHDEAAQFLKNTKSEWRIMTLTSMTTAMRLVLACVLLTFL